MPKDILGGSGEIGRRQQNATDQRWPERDQRLSRDTKLPEGSVPQELFDRLFFEDLEIDPDISLGWSQDELTEFIAKGLVPPGLTVESLIELISNSKIINS